MIFSLEKKNILIKQKGQGFSTFLTALLIATAFFLPFIFFGKGYFIFYGDFNVQQIPFYQMCHEAIRNGEFSYNWLTDLGTDFIGSYSFYLLGSPFFWLTIPFPNSFVPYLMGPLLILKFSLAALTAYLYIRRFTRTPFAAKIGGLVYAFSGFSIYNIFFNHFHEAIIYFPILLLALELLLTENKRGIFAITVALCAISNYFFFFGMVVFTIIYWFIRVISGAVKFKFSRFLALIAESVIGVLLASFILLPSVYMILGNYRVNEFLIGWSGILYGKEQIYLNIIECFFFPPDIPSRPVFFPGANVKWSSLGGWLPLVSMSGVIGFCISRRKHWLKRVICVSTFMAMVPILNSAFYAFNTSYYARWFYMPILMMALATAYCIEEENISWKEGFNWTAAITLGIALVIGLFPQKIDGKIVLGLYTDAGKSDNKYFFRFLTAVIIAVLCLVALRLVIYLREKSRLLFKRTLIFFLCISIVAYSSVYLYQGSAHSYDQESVMIDSLIEGNVVLPEEDNYRIDTFDCVDNTGMYLGYPCINAFHSVVSTSIMEYYDFIGVQRDVASRPEKEYYSIRNLLSVKYLLNRVDGESFVGEDGKTIMPGYRYLTTSDGYYLYENTNYIPFGFSYDYYLSKSECENLYQGVARANVMLKAIVLNDEDVEKYSPYMKSFSDFINEEHTVAEDGEAITDSKEMSVLTDEETLANDSARLKETAAIEFTRNSNGFSATVNRESSSLVFFSVPYSDGFTAYVNGEKAEIVKANVGFMAVVVPAGVSTIRFDYETPLLREGIIISLIAVCLFIIYLLINLLIRIKKKESEVYPEGEKLLKEWKETELEQNLNTGEENSNESATLLDLIPTGNGISIPKEEGKYTGFNINLNAFKEKDIDKESEE